MIRYQFCNGYVQGFVDAMRIEESLVDPKTMKAQLKKTICLPKSEVSTNELMLVFVKFTEDHPKLLHEDVSTVLHNALVKAYPCGMKSKTE